MTRKHRIDFTIALLVVGLMVGGLVVMYAIGPRVANSLNAQTGSNFSSNHFFVHHLISIGLSVAALIAGYMLKYEKVSKLSRWLLLGSILLCGFVGTVGRLGWMGDLITCDKGACRSLRIPGIGFGFMPTELLKVSIMFYIPQLIKKHKEQRDGNWNGFIIAALIILAAIALCVGVAESDFGSTVVIIAMVFTMMWIGGVPIKEITKMVIILAIGLALLIACFPYRMERIANFTGDGEDRYHANSAMISIATGGVTGVSLGNSIQSTGYLPEALSDSIFAIVCESFGLIGGIFVVAVFVMILMRTIRVAERTVDYEQRLAVIAVFAWIICHVIINIAGITGIMPMKGITLPFLSQGGTSMLFVAYAVGVVLQISSITTREKIKEENEDSSSRRGQWGTRYAGRSRRS